MTALEIRAAIAADPGRTNKSLARSINASYSRIRRERARMGLPQHQRGKRREVRWPETARGRA